MSASKSIGVIFTIALTALCVLAQTQQPNSESLGPQRGGTITGQVVDENDQGVPYARVEIHVVRPNPNNHGNQGQTLFADTNGEFLIKNLEPVDYGFHASAASYMPGPTERLRDNGVYRVGDRVRLRLIKGGVVTGKVTDAFGKPVVGVGVRAQMVRDTEGRVLPRGNYFDKVTDDRGVYRIFGLWPGTYVVVAGGPNIFVRNSDRYDYQLDVPTYAPSSTRETAAEISMRGGEEVSDVDIRYRGERGRIISGDVTLPSNLHTEFLVTLMSGGDAELPLSSTSRRRPGGGFIFEGVGDGEYKLIAQSSDSSGEIALSESKPISVRGSDVTGIKLTAKVLGSVSGRVVLQETKIAECTDKQHPLAYEAFVVASPRENEAAKQIPQMLQQLWSLGERSRPDRDGSFLLKNLAAGEYHFGLGFHAPQWYVNSITFVPAVPNATAKSVDATRVWTNVKASERLANLTVTLVQGGASLRGMLVLGEGEQVPRGLFVYLVPAEREKANDVLRFFAAPVQSNGYIGFANVPPGRYWIVAQPGEETPTMPLTTKIRLPNEAETRKRLRLDAEAAKNEIELKPCQTIDTFRLSLKPATQN
jgi:hypothetical protein